MLSYCVFFTACLTSLIFRKHKRVGFNKKFKQTNATVNFHPRTRPRRQFTSNLSKLKNKQKAAQQYIVNGKQLMSTLAEQKIFRCKAKNKTLCYLRINSYFNYLCVIRLQTFRINASLWEPNRSDKCSIVGFKSTVLNQ